MEQAATRYAALRAAQHALWRVAGRPFGDSTEWSAGSGRRLPENPIVALLAIADRGGAWIPTAAQEQANIRAARTEADETLRRMKRRQVPLGTF